MPNTSGKSPIGRPAESESLTRMPRRIKQVVHGFGMNDARFLKNAKNSLNGLHFGAGVLSIKFRSVRPEWAGEHVNYSD